MLAGRKMYTMPENVFCTFGCVLNPLSSASSSAKSMRVKERQYDEAAWPGSPRMAKKETVQSAVVVVGRTDEHAQCV